jgi:recombination protein RecR
LLLPKSITNLIESFERLPGIGPKSAQRLAFYLLHVPQENLDQFANNLKVLKTSTKLCSQCKNIDESDPCRICSDNQRNKSVICVVEQPLDLIALENTRKYKGLYHVLHGAIAPLSNVGPDEIYIADLIKRIQNLSPFKGGTLQEQGGTLSEITEIIFATNPTLEGEATSMFIEKELDKIGYNGRRTRLARGLPTGGDLEYADELTLSNALEGRK